MEKGDWRKDEKSNENLNSSKGKGNSKIPTAEPSKWAKYHQGWIYDFILYIYTYFFLIAGVFKQPPINQPRRRPQHHQQGMDESDDEMDDMDTSSPLVNLVLIKQFCKFLLFYNFREHLHHQEVILGICQRRLRF